MLGLIKLVTGLPWEHMVSTLMEGRIESVEQMMEDMGRQMREENHQNMESTLQQMKTLLS